MSAEKNKNQRREFLKALGFAFLTLEVLPSRVNANTINKNFSPEHDDPEFPPKIDQNQLVINSGLGFIPHRHDLMISMDLLAAPPSEGVRLKTTITAFHYHMVDLSQQQLETIKNGQAVVLRDSTVGEHLFMIYLPKQIRKT